MPDRPLRPLTALIEASRCGDPSAAGELLPLIYDELRKLAASRLRRLPNAAAGQTLQATSLVHEAYLRLIGDQGNQMKWDSRAHFFGAAARAMHNILVENARRKGRVKHGGGRQRLSFDESAHVSEEPETDYIALDASLERLSHLDARKCEIVMLKYYAGLTIEEIGQAIGVSAATVKRDWEFAKAWLHEDMAAA